MRKKIKQLFCSHRYTQKWLECSYIECNKCEKGYWFAVPVKKQEQSFGSGIKFMRFFNCEWEFPKPVSNPLILK